MFVLKTFSYTKRSTCLFLYEQTTKSTLCSLNLIRKGKRLGGPIQTKSLSSVKISSVFTEHITNNIGRDRDST